MSNEKIKFTEDELKDILSLQDSYRKTLLKFGEHQVRGYMLEEEINRMKKVEETLKQEYVDIQTRESELLKTITEKYGEGSLDISTGEFIPTQKSSAEPEKV